jgi:hypothetical protein
VHRLAQVIELDRSTDAMNTPSPDVSGGSEDTATNVHQGRRSQSTSSRTMESLPDELLQIICDLAITDARDATARSLAVVSRRVRVVSLSVAWRSLSFTMPNEAFLFALHLEAHPEQILPVQNLLMWAYGPVHPSLWSSPKPNTAKQHSLFGLDRLWKKSEALQTDPIREEFPDGRAAMDWAFCRILSGLAPTLRFVGYMAENPPAYAFLPVDLPQVEEIVIGISARTYFNNYTHLNLPCSWNTTPTFPLEEKWPSLRRLHMAVDNSSNLDLLGTAVAGRLRTLARLAPALTHLRLSCCLPWDFAKFPTGTLPTGIQRITFQPRPSSWMNRFRSRDPWSSDRINTLPEQLQTYVSAWRIPLGSRIALTDWEAGPRVLKKRYAARYLGQVAGVLWENFNARHEGGRSHWDEGQLMLSDELTVRLMVNATATWGGDSDE